ncbi:MAG TPA: hypothetical protein VMG35_24995 [Bryobacteraceae bacterium]|nr:hypothetical protein [Bryobacteraceae bacterium]
MKENAGFTAAIIALVALAAHVVGPTGREAGPAGQAETGAKAKKAHAQQAEEPGTPYEGPWIATRHFFAPYEPPASIAQNVDVKNPRAILRCSGDPKCLPQLQQFFGLSNTDNVECLLATVPDPFHTRLALFTDRTIAAILKGAAEEDWELATQWLPWNDTVDPDEGDPAKRARQRSDVRAQEKQPGVLVFRRAQGTLLVFVVGETPIAGVNPGQFQIARAYMNALCGPKGRDAVRIDGPTFSGSFDSLARLILQDKSNQPGVKYEVQSGTAQSPGGKKAFAGDKVEFHSATEDVADQGRHFQHLLKDLGISSDRAAVLAEDESAFGTAATPVHWLDPKKPYSLPLRVFHYPRDISHLRNVYRQIQKPAQPGNVSAPNLDFSLKDPSVGEDSVPTYSQTQMPLSQNGVVNEITRAIRRDDIRIVEVSATNVLDLLFLAGVLRQQCPDTRLLIQSADLLFVQAEQTQPLDGTLFLTSYPLLAESNLWEGRDDHRVFSDTLSEGVFNATVLLLGDQTKLADYAWHSAAYPPAWLLTLDHRGFMPVRVWPNDASPGWFQSVSRDTKLDVGALPAPRIWKVLVSAFAVFGAAIGVWILTLSHKKDWVVDARFEHLESKDSWHGFYLLLFLLILIGMQIAIRAARPLGADGTWLIVALLGCALPAWIAVRYCRMGDGQLMASWLALGAILSGVWLWSFSCSRGAGPLVTQGQLFSFRAAELRFGSSPLWPIVAAATALLLWCSVHVTRLYFASYQQPEVTTDGLDSVLSGRLKKCHGHFIESARSLLGLCTGEHQFGLAIAVAASAVVCFLFRVDLQLASIDGRPYDLLCTTLHLLLAGLLLLTCWHILDLWKSLHCFTTSLDILPLARAFIRAAPAGSSRPIWVRRLNLQSLDVHINSVKVLHDMQLYGNQLAKFRLSEDQVSQWLKPYGEGIADLLQDPPPGDRKDLANRHRELCRQSKDVASQLWKVVLKPAWASEPMVGTLAGKPSSKPEEPPEGKHTVTLISEQPLRIAGDPGNVVDLAQTFVALHFTPFLLYGVRQIQNLLWFPSIGFVLLLFSMKSYSFQAPEWIGRFLLVLFVCITLMLGKCMVGIERDPILSRIGGTTPGELNAGFYLRLVRYGALPILGLLASLFPAISNVLFSWFEPALEAMK